MHVERYGSGPVHYFGLHGWGADRRTFAPLAPHVPADATFHSADLPGCGLSPAPPAWSLEAVTDSIVESMRATGAGSLTVVGNCGGAVFGLLAARRLGSSVSRVVMIDAFAYLPRYFSLFAKGEFGRRAYEATFANPLGRWLTNQSLRGRRGGAADLTASFADVDHEVARRYLALFDEVGGAGRFRGTAQPADVVYGERSFGAVRRSVALWREVMPQARERRLEGVGHAPLLEAAARVAEIVFAPQATAGTGAVRARRAEESEAEQ